jgi:hypothetical protein
MFEENTEQIEQLISGLISCPESLRPILAEGISRLQRKPRRTFEVYATKEVIKTSIETLATTYFIHDLYYDWPDQPPQCDKYVMFQCIFDDAFSNDEITSLINKFQKFAKIFLKPNFLLGVLEIQNKGYTAPRNKSQPIQTGPTPSDWTDYLQFFVIFAGGMTNYLNDCPSSIARYPNYIPFYIRRYEKVKSPDGSWEMGFAPLNTLCTRWNLEVNFNAKALNEAGFSDATWVGAIVHEIMHNGGWEHPNGYGDTSQFLIAVGNLAEQMAK